MASQQTEPAPAEVLRAELHGKTRAAWVNLPRKKQEAIHELDFIKRFDKTQVFFDAPYPVSYVSKRLCPKLANILQIKEQDIDVVFFSSADLKAQRAAEQLQELIRDPGRADLVSFGEDVAEHDADLLNYFVTTKTFERAAKGTTSVIIGPKGSGKTAILKALYNKHGSNTSIVITPEIFATSVLSDIIDTNKGSWDESQAFTSTWMYTILIEVFRRLDANPKGVSASGLKNMRRFLHDNVSDANEDIFTRFVGYLKRIEGIKVGPMELTVKTRKLQELYSLAPLYQLIPNLRTADDRILILIDELDQGWDNSSHANLFIASLLQATVRIQSLGLEVHVITFLRSEIFDLVKDSFQHLDKLRSRIEHLRWSDGELSELISKRISYSLRFNQSFSGYERSVTNALFDGSVGGVDGFSYLLSRTTYRPREVLQFVSLAYRIATERDGRTITPYALLQAEEEFSTWKFEHLCAEYTYVYPQIRDLILEFRGKGPILSQDDALDVVTLDQLKRESDGPEWLKQSAVGILQLLYNIDVIGVPKPEGARRKPGPLRDYEFAYERGGGKVSGMASFVIHPVYWPLLEIGMP